MFSAFISYRRDYGWQFAMLLETKLQALGFSVFLDHKSIHAGRFDEEIINAIDAAPDFLLILSKDSLVRRGEPDYFFNEIKHALLKKKKIIPIFLSEFSEPQDLCEEIAPVLKYNGLHETLPQFFDSAFLPQLIYYMSTTEEKMIYNSTVENRSYLTSRSVLERESLEDRWNNAIEIDICALYANMLLNAPYVVKKLEEGVKFRFLIMDPASEAAKESATYKLKRGKLSKFRQAYAAIESLLEDIEYAKENDPDDAILNGQIEFRKTTLFVPAAIMTVRKTVRSENTVKVDYYSFNSDDPERRSIIISAADEDNYAFYCNQFDYIWNHHETIPVLLNAEET